MLDVPLTDGTLAIATVRNLRRTDRPARGAAAARRRARHLALRHHPHRHAAHHHRRRAADPRLRLPLAGEPRPRGRRHLRHRAGAHRHRADARALRPVGLGHGPRPDVLVLLDVRDAGAGAARRTGLVRRCRQSGASRRRQSLRDRQGDRRQAGPHHRPRVPHEARRGPLCVAARPRRGGGAGEWRAAAPRRHRRRRHRGTPPRRAQRHRRHAAARRHREHLEILRAVGRRQPAGDVQLQVPGAARPRRRHRHHRHAVRDHRERWPASRWCAPR